MPTGLEIPNAQEKSHIILSSEWHWNAFAGPLNLFLSHRFLFQVYKEIVIKDSQKCPKLLILILSSSKMWLEKIEKNSERAIDIMNLNF